MIVNILCVAGLRTVGCIVMKLNPSALLFDMDGVLVDSFDSWWVALNLALKASHHKEITREEFLEKYWGHDLDDNVKAMGLEREVGNLCVKIYSNQVDMVRIYPGTTSILQKLDGYKKGIITNTPRNCTDKILNKFNMRRYFDAVITSDDVTKGKPNPEVIFMASDVLDVNPKKIVLVGDTESDVKAGKAAGCIVIGLNIEADYTIRSLSELLDILLH
jgi:HAD superfamily hydrolase (TIGR01509 family)